jgi:diguanylate cyclase (GGDEF)-like protein
MAGHDPISPARVLTPLLPELPLRQQGRAAVLAVVDAVSAAREPAAVGQRLLAVLQEVLPSAAAGVVLACRGEPPLAARAIDPPSAEQLAGALPTESARPACLELDGIALNAAARRHLQSAGYRGLLALPLVAGADYVGSALLLLPAHYRLTPALSETLAAMAGSAALALAAAFERQTLASAGERLAAERDVARRQLAAERRVRREAEALARAARDRLETRSGVDMVSGLTSGRHFHFLLEVEVERSRRYSDALGLLLIDIDEFRRFNDAYGHAEGDRVLARLGEILRQELRKVDTAFRYGGEEFMVILPRCDQRALLNLAERLRERLAAEPFHVGEQTSRLSVSIGAAVYRRGLPVESFIRHVDGALYRAKTDGRNRVVLA